VRRNAGKWLYETSAVRFNAHRMTLSGLQRWNERITNRVAPDLHHVFLIFVS